MARYSLTDARHQRFSEVLPTISYARRLAYQFGEQEEPLGRGMKAEGEKEG